MLQTSLKGVKADSSTHTFERVQARNLKACDHGGPRPKEAGTTSVRMALVAEEPRASWPCLRNSSRSCGSCIPCLAPVPGVPKVSWSYEEIC